MSRITSSSGPFQLTMGSLFFVSGSMWLPSSLYILYILYIDLQICIELSYLFIFVIIFFHVIHKKSTGSVLKGDLQVGNVVDAAADLSLRSWAELPMARVGDRSDNDPINQVDLKL